MLQFLIRLDREKRGKFHKVGMMATITLGWVCPDASSFATARLIHENSVSGGC